MILRGRTVLMMDSIVRNKYFDRLEDFIASIGYGGELQQIFAKGSFIFRGHSSEKYELVPSALRYNIREHFFSMALGNDHKDTEYFQIIKEYNILRRFFKLCDFNGLLVDDIERIRNTWQERMDFETLIKKENWLPTDLWNIAAFAQHYGLPTRLLDWTHNRFVALYFAIENYLEGSMNPTESDNIVIWAMNINIFNNQANLGLPFVFVQPAYHGNVNLTAQQGLFTLWQTKKDALYDDDHLKVNMELKVDRRALDVLLNEYFMEKGEKVNPFIYKISIPSKFFKDIYRYLVDVGYDASRIYPGYRGVAKAIEHNKYLIRDEQMLNSGVAFVR